MSGGTCWCHLEKIISCERLQLRGGVLRVSHIVVSRPLDSFRTSIDVGGWGRVVLSCDSVPG